MTIHIHAHHNDRTTKSVGDREKQLSIVFRREITKTRSIGVRVYRGRIDDYVFGSKHDIKPLSYVVATLLLFLWKNIYTNIFL